MAFPRRLGAVAGLAALTVFAPACHKRLHDVEVVGARDPQTPRERCRVAFVACAPSVNFSPDTDVTGLGIRNLVHLASRLDVADRLSAAAAKELLKIASTGDADTLLDVQEAIEDTSFALGKCRCDGVVPEIEKQRIADVVASRAPPRTIRSPEHWAERILAQLGTVQTLSRRAVELALGGDDAVNEELGARQRDAEHEICVTLHAARDALAPPAFAASLDLVYSKRAHEAGEGSAELARRTLAKYEASASCDAPEP